MTDKVALPVPGLGPKLGSGVTVSAMVVVAVSDGEVEVPVMVTVTGVELAVAVELAVRVSTWVSLAVPAAKLAVTPEGKPDAA